MAEVEAVLSEPRPSKQEIAALEARAEKAYSAYVARDKELAAAQRVLNEAVAAVSAAQVVLDAAHASADGARVASQEAIRAAFTAKQDPLFRVTVVDRGGFVPVGPDARNLDAVSAARFAQQYRDSELVRTSNGGYEVLVRKEG